MIYTQPGQIDPETIYVCDRCGRHLRLAWQGRAEQQLLQRAAERDWTIQGDNCRCQPWLCGLFAQEPASSQEK